MNASREQMQIIKTVVTEFLQTDPATTEEILPNVAKYVQGNINKATVRCGLRDLLVKSRLGADDERLNLCIDTAHALACGYMHWIQGQENPDELDIYPALQLFDCYHHAERVDWVQKWRDNGGRVFQKNEMIALRNDPIWTRISVFGLPFPPFDLNSGMDIDVVPRNEAVKLGLISANDQGQPIAVNFEFGPALRQRLTEVFGSAQQEPRVQDQLDEQSDGFSLLSNALARLKSCGRQIDKDTGAEILNTLTEAAQRIPQRYSELHAQIFRATGEILEDWGDTAQAIEYYEYAVQKNPNIGVKRKLDLLRKSVA